MSLADQARNAAALADATDRDRQRAELTQRAADLRRTAAEDCYSVFGVTPSPEDFYSDSGYLYAGQRDVVVNLDGVWLVVRPGAPLRAENRYETPRFTLWRDCDQCGRPHGFDPRGYSSADRLKHPANLAELGAGLAVDGTAAFHRNPGDRLERFDYALAAGLARFDKVDA